MKRNANILQIENLEIHFDTFEGTARVLDGVSLELAPGDTLGVVGETGCGKPITSKAVLGLLLEPQQNDDQLLLEGDIPSPLNIPSGCSFHTRCPEKVGDICHQVDPQTIRLSTSHTTACHRYSNVSKE